MIDAYYQNYGSVNIMGGHPASSMAPCVYRLIEVHYLNYEQSGGRTYEIDDIVTEGIEIPFGWFPTLAVDPQNLNAAARYWEAGPRDLATAYSNDLSVYGDNLYRSRVRPVTYWTEVGVTGLSYNSSYINYGSINIMGGPTFPVILPGTWRLTGLGEIFGLRSEDAI